MLCPEAVLGAAEPGQSGGGRRQCLSSAEHAMGRKAIANLCMTTKKSLAAAFDAIFSRAWLSSIAAEQWMVRPFPIGLTHEWESVLKIHRIKGLS